MLIEKKEEKKDWKGFPMTKQNKVKVKSDKLAINVDDLRL